MIELRWILVNNLENINIYNKIRSGKFIEKVSGLDGASIQLQFNKIIYFQISMNNCSLN